MRGLKEEDGTVTDMVGVLTFEPKQDAYVFHYIASGRTVVMTGNPDEESGAFVSKGQGIRWTLTSVSEGKRCEGTVETEEGEGKWKLFSRSVSVKADRQIGAGAPAAASTGTTAGRS